MRVHIDEEHARILVEFLGENWSKFETFCEKRGNENDAENVYEELMQGIS